MKFDRIFIATILIILLSVLISGCVQTSQSTQSSSKGISSAVITEHTYLFGDQGLFTKKYDLTVIILTKSTDYKDLSKEQLRAFLDVYGLESSKISSTQPMQTINPDLNPTTISSSSTTLSSEFVKPGDTVIVDFTLYDAKRNPIITSDEQVYKNLRASGKGILLSNQRLTITSGTSLNKEIYPVQISTSSGVSQQFAMFSTEYNTISANLVGMRVGDQNHIAIDSNGPLTQTWSAEQLQQNNVNMSDIHIGDLLVMPISANPEDMRSSASTITYIRMGEITAKTNAAVIVDYGYPYADIGVISINSK
jgi:hypothetical protein